MFNSSTKAKYKKLHQHSNGLISKCQTKDTKYQSQCPDDIVYNVYIYPVAVFGQDIGQIEKPYNAADRKKESIR